MNLRWSRQFLAFSFDWHLLIVNINEASAVFQRLVKFRLPDSHLNPFPMSFSISHNQYSLVRFNFSSLHMMRVNLGDLVSKSGLFNLTSSSSVYLLRMTDFILFGWIAEASSVIKQRGNTAQLVAARDEDSQDRSSKASFPVGWINDTSETTHPDGFELSPPFQK